MATAYRNDWTRPVVRERAFFLGMAVVTTVTTVSGFVLSLGMGRSSFDAPWWVHVHGVTMMGWLGLYLVQNVLVYQGNVTAHRTLGPLAAAYSLWIVAVGFGANTLSALTHRIPPFFETNVFLAMDYLTVITFAGLTWTGIALRHRPDWHRRLMLCSAIQVMTPGLGRLLPLPLLGQWIIPAIWATLIPYMAVAIGYDIVTRGRPHPAYAWGFGALTLATALMRPLAFTPPLLALTAALTR